MPEAAGFPVTVWDDKGDAVRIEPRAGTVLIRTSPAGVALNAVQRNEFDQAYTAACHEANRQGTGPATEPPLHYDEGITGMHWDSLGSVGDG